MPSRHLLQQPSPPHPRHHRLRPHHHSWPLFLIAAGAAAAAAAALLILAFLLHRRRRLRRLKNHNDPPQPPPTDPEPDPPSTCRPFTYSDLRRATSCFSPSNKLGQGGFGPVYLGNLTGKPVAVKLLDPGSLQGEREFRNELWLAPVVGVCDRVVAPLGFCSGPSGRMLVYELMRNGSVQEALLDKRRPELMVWGVRLSVALDVARALEFLHFGCNPPIVHGDVKPSNVLLDADFSAKIADFGLARFVVVDDDAVMNTEDDNRSLTAESECTTTAATTVTAFEQSPEPVDGDSNASPAVKKRSASGGDWWWRQDRNGGGGGGGSSNVKDYVMQWIGSEVNKERPRGQWAEGDVGPKPEGKKMKKRPMEWWASLDEERRSARRKKKKPREWWREEFCEELTNKANKKKQKNKKAYVGEVEPKKQQWWQNQSDGDDAEEVNSSRKKLRKDRQRSSDWWADGASSELRIGRRNSQDSGVGVSGDTVPKSGGVSSTPSMRGTVCYAAPEYGGGGPLSEKCDVYSFGVLMLVIISGRRPLQVACSPMSEFERANLVSWARQLARAGKLMDLVDQNICNLDSDQALMCITVALLCLQRSPARRPSMKEVVGMLCGETEPPHLPVEFSPSPPGGFTFKSPKKARPTIEGFKIRQVTT